MPPAPPATPTVSPAAPTTTYRHCTDPSLSTGGCPGLPSHLLHSLRTTDVDGPYCWAHATARQHAARTYAAIDYRVTPVA